jgi:hypothetical protein
MGRGRTRAGGDPAALVAAGVPYLHNYCFLRRYAGGADPIDGRAHFQRGSIARQLLPQLRSAGAGDQALRQFRWSVARASDLRERTSLTHRHSGTCPIGHRRTGCLARLKVVPRLDFVRHPARSANGLINRLALKPSRRAAEDQSAALTLLHPRGP